MRNGHGPDIAPREGDPSGARHPGAIGGAPGRDVVARASRGPRQVPVRRRREVLGPWRHLRHLRSRRRRAPVSGARAGRARFRADGAGRIQHRARLHAAAALAARSRGGAGPAGDGGAAVGAARRVPGRTGPRARDRGQAARRRARQRGPSGDPLLRHRQRDPGGHRPLARPAADRAVPRAALSRGEGGGPRGAGHLRQLPDHRVPAAAVPRLPLLQRLPRVARPARGLPGAAAESRRREAAADGGDRPRQPAQRPRAAGREPRLAGAGVVRRRLRRGDGVRLDRRVAPRRPRHRRLGFRPDRARPQPEARAGRRRAGLRGGPVPGRHALAARHRRGRELQRRAHHPRHASRG